MVAANHSRSSIRCLIDANGNKLYSFSQISNEAVSFFQNLIGTKDDQVTGCAQEILEEIIQTVLPLDAASNISKPITLEEIRSSMFSINGDKAPEPDGYSACFFRVAWPIVGDDVIQAILYFFFRLIECCLLLIPLVLLLC